MKKSKMGQIRFSVSDDILADLNESARLRSCSVSAEIRARLRAFREEHRLVEVTRWVPASEVAKEQKQTPEMAPELRIPTNVAVPAKWATRSTFTVDEAGCEILGLSRCSAYAAAKNGSLPTVRVGRRLIVPRLALERMLGEA